MFSMIFQISKLLFKKFEQNYWGSVVFDSLTALAITTPPLAPTAPPTRDATGVTRAADDACKAADTPKAESGA
jgi:hypothetical protein